MKPYTYLLRHKLTNTFYYGVRWAKNCNPEEFWSKYFTSSDSVALLRTLFGDDSFEFEIRRVFENKKKAQEWEHKVLRRMKVLKKQNVWLNRTDNKCIMNTSEMTVLAQKKRILTIKIRNSLSGKNNPRFGKIMSYYQKQRISESSKRLKWYNNGMNNVRLDIDSPIPSGYKLGRLINHDKNGRFICHP